MATGPVSPVRTRRTSLRSSTMIFPSPMRPVRAPFLAPHAQIRAQIVPQPAATGVSASVEDPPKSAPEQSAGAQRWAELLARVFGIDMQKCADCGSPLKIVSAIVEPTAVRTILTYLSLPDKPTALAPARIPEQSQFA